MVLEKGQKCDKHGKNKRHEKKHSESSTSDDSESSDGVSKSQCDRCGNALMRNNLCKTCDGKSGKVKKSYKARKQAWILKAMEGQPGTYPYRGPLVPSTIEELSGKTLKQLAILPRNEGETEVVLRALEIMGLESRAREQLQEVYAGRFGEGQV
jgi:hypothetical protein